MGDPDEKHCLQTSYYVQGRHCARYEGKKRVLFSGRFQISGENKLNQMLCINIKLQINMNARKERKLTLTAFSQKKGICLGLLGEGELI